MHRNRETVKKWTRNNEYEGSNEKETTCLPHPPTHPRPAPLFTKFSDENLIEQTRAEANCCLAQPAAVDIKYHNLILDN